ncbi:hypothetical protein D3C80_1817230 [compost metagenome]
MKFMRIQMSKYEEGVSRTFLYCILPNHYVLLLADTKDQMAMYIHEQDCTGKQTSEPSRERQDLYVQGDQERVRGLSY